MVIRRPPGGEDRRARSYTRGMSARSAVEVRNLVKRYGRTTAADRLSFTVKRGSVTGILGPNGAGKTTAVEICEGFRRPDSGMVRVLGSDPIADGRRLRPRVGVMLQAGGGSPVARPGELLAYSARPYAHPINPADLAARLAIDRRSR